MQKRVVVVEKMGKEVFCSKINGDKLLLHITSVFPVSSLCLADSLLQERLVWEKIGKEVSIPVSMSLAGSSWRSTVFYRRGRWG